jgi:hypothetical protein
LEKVFSYVVLWLWIGDKVSWFGCIFEELAKKQMSKDECDFFTPN